MKKRLMSSFIVIVFICILANVIPMISSAKEEAQICKGIFVDGIDIGGMTKEEAEQEVNNYISQLQSKRVVLNIGDSQIETTLDEIGYQAEENTYIEDALNFGKTGNLIKRYKQLKDVEYEQVTYELSFRLNPETVREFVEANSKNYGNDPINAKLERKDGEFIVTEHVVGEKVSIEDTTNKILSYIENDWNEEDIIIDAVINEVQPEFTTDIVSKCKDVIGQFSTTYTSSSASRANNLANGARLINGTVLYPGEEFSTSKELSPITEENGFSNAGAYQNGKVIDSIGGGVCQVSTTLYNAILLAELEITERHNHSMIVGYVEPAMDAAIAEGYKDLKFKNNTNAPIYVEAVTEGRKITFTLYGEETRDLANRKVKYVSETIAKISPGEDKVTEDPTKPVGYTRVEQSAHVGYKANLWKVVTENGVEVSKEKVNYSSYAAEPRHVIKGTKEKEEEETPTPEPGSTEIFNPEEPDVTTKPIIVTKEPEITKKPADHTKEPDVTKEPVVPKPTKEPVIETPQPTKEPVIETPQPQTELPPTGGASDAIGDQMSEDQQDGM